MEIFSFDFDGTLCCLDEDNNSLMIKNDKICDTLKKIKKKSNKVIITSFRDPVKEDPVYQKTAVKPRFLIKDFLKKYKIDVDDIILTNHTSKLPFLMNNQVNVHYDDDVGVISELVFSNIKGILVTPIIIKK